MEDLEAKLVSSRKVRDFLKHFSVTQWSRVIKATVIMGIQELEKNHPVAKLSAKDVEDIVGKSKISRYLRAQLNLNFAPKMLNFLQFYSVKRGIVKE